MFKNLKTRWVVLAASVSLAIGTLLVLGGGNKSLPPEPSTPQDATAQIETHRERQNRQFRTSTDSPIPPAQREHFRGLRYFPIDLAFRVQGRFEPANGAFPPVPIPGNANGQEYAGQVSFNVQGKPYSLAAYRSQEQPRHELFVPFLDATSGDETYGSGRYLNLVVREGNKVWVDFNYAYNPYCAYDENYVCPKPPPANTLLVAIRAGEMTPRH